MSASTDYLDLVLPGRPVEQTTITVNLAGVPQTCPGWVIAPGLAVVADPGRTLTDGRYRLAHTTSGQFASFTQCGTCMYDIVERAVNSGIDWTGDADQVKRDADQLGDAMKFLSAGCTCGEYGKPATYQPPKYPYPGRLRETDTTASRAIPRYRLRHGLVPDSILADYHPYGERMVGWWVHDADPGILDTELGYLPDTPEGAVPLATAHAFAAELVATDARYRTCLDVKVAQWMRPLAGPGWVPELAVETHHVTIHFEGHTQRFEVDADRARRIVTAVDEANQPPYVDGDHGGLVWPQHPGILTLPLTLPNGAGCQIHIAAKKVTHVDVEVTTRPLTDRDWHTARR